MDKKKRFTFADAKAKIKELEDTIERLMVVPEDGSIPVDIHCLKTANKAYKVLFIVTLVVAIIAFIY